MRLANALMSMEKKDKRTRSLLVIHKDKIIAEKYDVWVSKRKLGWSMTKSN
jgi:hypothetical protein